MFDLKEVNTGRQFEIDVAKAMAIIFMIVIHTFEQLTDMGNLSLYRVVEFFGCPPAAGVFMFAMGIGMVYTKHGSPAEFTKRGVKLILIGIVLNFFRETVLVIAGNILGIDNPWQDTPILHTMLLIDILQFAGMAFLITALFKKLNMKPWIIAAAAIFMNAIGSLFAGSFGNLPDAVQDIFGTCIFTAVEPAFPAFQWYIYPALGICFAHLLRHVTDKTAFYKRMLFISSAVMLSVTLGCLTAGVYVIDFFMTSAYYLQSPLTCFWCLSVVAVCIPMYYFLSLAIRGNGQTAVKYLSAKVNTIYIIQWLVITYSIGVLEILGMNMFPSVWGIPLGLLITAISILICILYYLVKARVRGKTASL